MKKRLYILTFMLLAAAFGLHAQSDGQRDLLGRAYDTKSYDLLGKFFDNWQKEYADNEAEAPDKWVAEAHKVFAAMLRPDISSKIGVEVSGPILVVQGSLGRIGCVKGNMKAFRDGNLDSTIYFIVDSAIDFRPKYQLENLTTVYLTEGYKLIVDDFFSTFFPDPTLSDSLFDDLTKTDSVWSITDNVKIPYDEFEAKLNEQFARESFLKNYAGSIYCFHLAAPTTIIPFLTIEEIVFDRSLHYAVVVYSQCISGGTVVLKKVKNKWTFDHDYDYWIE